jgi:hypothetical protein
MPTKPRLVIRCPNGADDVPGMTYKSNGTDYYFVVACGRASGFDFKKHSLVASLLSEDGQVIVKGKLLHKGVHWVFGFEGLPTSNTKKKYHLLVGQTGATDAGGNVAATRDFTVSPPAPSGAAAAAAVAGAANAAAMPSVPPPPPPVPGPGPLPGPGPGSAGNPIPIQSPAAQSSQCPQFTASGALVDGTPTTGANMWIGTTKLADGIPLQAPLGLWLYSFSNVPENSGYTFKVTDGTHSGESDNITVDSATCGPSPGGG